jgi:cell division FtsZ-interacting protein ZapD
MKSFLAEAGMGRVEPDGNKTSDKIEDVRFEDMIPLSFKVLKELETCLREATTNSNEIDLDSDALKNVREMSKIITRGQVPNEILHELDTNDKTLITQMANDNLRAEIKEKVKYLTELTKSLTKVFKNI